MYIVTYDISDSKERAKVVKCVEQYCLRMQKSVWAGDFSGQTLKKLCDRLEEIHLTTGMVDIWEGEKPRRIGNGPPLPEPCACHIA